MADLLGIDRRENKENPEYLNLQGGGITSGSLTRYKRINGGLKDGNNKKSQFNEERYKFFLEAPFEITDKCCDIMKKNPAHDYEKITGRKPFIGTQCTESKLRTQKWLQEGCNAFYSDSPKSKPLSFWTEQDILLYIKTRNLKIASVYGEIVQDNEQKGQIKNQMTIADFVSASEKELFDLDKPIWKTTGCKRTGCIFCGFGCHLEKEGEGRFERLKVTHPKIYEYIMKPTSEGGLGYKEIIDWINEHGNLHIRY